MYKIHVKRALIFLVVGMLTGLIAALVLPKVWLSEADVVVADPTQQHVEYAALNDEVANILISGARQNARSEIAVLGSEKIFAEALEQLQVEDLGRSSLGDLKDSDLTATYRLPKELDEDYEHHFFLMYDVDVPPSESPYDPVRFAAIKVKTNNRQLSSDLANRIVVVYNKKRQDEWSKSVQDALDLLSGLVNKANQTVLAADEKIRVFKNEHNLADLSTELTQQSGYLTQLQQQRDLALGQYNGAVANLDQLRSQLSSIPKRSDDVAQDRPSPQIDQMEQTVATLEAQRIDILESYTENSPLAKNNERGIAQAKAALAREQKYVAKQQIKSTRQDPLREDLLQRISVADGLVKTNKQLADKYVALVAVAQASLAKLPNEEKELTDLLRERDLADKDYQNLRAQQSDVQVRQKQGYLNAEPIADAVPAQKPFAPEPRRYMAIAGVLFLCLGLVYSFMVESLKLPVYTSSQLTDLTGVLVGASIPSLPKKQAATRALTMGRSSFQPAESLRYMAVSALAEQFDCKVVLVTAIGTSIRGSAVAGELAIAFAHAGAKTILVDADLRSRPLEASFGTSETTGVADLLSRSALGSGVESITVATQHPNLEYLPAGASDFSQALADFPLAYIQALVQILRSKAEVVIINCPPCNVVADAARIAPFVDEVSMVVSAKSTSFRDIPTSQDLLLRAGAKAVNIVLTNASGSEEPFARPGAYAESRAS